MTLYPDQELHHGDPVLVNIVTHSFAEKSFNNIDKTEELIVVDGVSGVKYIYDWKSDTEIAIILPIKDYKMILGTNGHYEELFAGVVESFEFVDE
ncbi:MAG: hypothetical protein H6780_01195 [Candidatus Nomurabacteria bacterium]|nr:MAG: hypothetical protein H6780_01195 [Candidatus Nomurabacteria bacterium]